MRKIAIYGGTFDPVTPAHIEIIKYLRKIYDHVIIVPTTVTYYRHKNGQDELSFTFEERCEILDSAIDDLHQGYIIVDRIDGEDKELDESHGFSDTLTKLVEKYGKENEYTVVMGADSFMGMHRWRRYEKILELAKILVIARPGFEVKNPEVKVEPEVLALDMKISATQIRKDLKRIVKILNEYPLMQNYLVGVRNYLSSDIRHKEVL